jgi:hypothetical protein
MRNILYYFASAMIILWAFGYFAYNSGGLIHILLILAIIFLLARIIPRNRRID